MRRPGLQLEITASLLVLMLGALALASAVTAGSVIQMARGEAAGRLRMGAAFLERAVSGGSRLEDVAALARASTPGLVGGTFRIVDAHGRELNSGPPVPLSLEGLDRLLEHARSGEQLRVDGSVPGEIVLVRRVRSETGREGFLIGQVSRAQLLESLGPLLRTAVWVLGVAPLIFVGFGTYVLRRAAVRPLQALAATTRRIAGADLGARTRVEGPREIAELAEHFNEMAESLERQRSALDAAHRSLSRSEKLATVGQLAAGVAHEVGNPVTAILGYAAVLQRDPALGERSREVSRQIRDEALRIQKLVREMLDLSRVDAVEPCAVDAAALARGVAARLARQPLLDGIELDVRVEPALEASVEPAIHAEADPGRVEQILTNLIHNAAQALAVQPGPRRIEVRVAVWRLPERRGRRRGDLAPDADQGAPAVAIEVVDNGPGIAEESLAQVFDPFFTTKEPGEGTGLGLWNAHRMAELMGGALEVDSASGRTCFRLVLRAADTTAAHDRPDPDHR